MVNFSYGEKILKEQVWPLFNQKDFTGIITGHEDSSRVFLPQLFLLGQDNIDWEKIKEVRSVSGLLCKTAGKYTFFDNFLENLFVIRGEKYFSRQPLEGYYGLRKEESNTAIDLNVQIGDEDEKIGTFAIEKRSYYTLTLEDMTSYIKAFNIKSSMIYQFKQIQE